MYKFQSLIIITRTIVVLVVISLCACSSANFSTDSIDVTTLAESDIDGVIELQQEIVMRHLKQLMLKLYRRNPAGRYDKNIRSVGKSVDHVFAYPFDGGFPQWEGWDPDQIIYLAFEDSYIGSDRILPLIVGLRRMLMASYGNQTEFYFFTSIDQQKLYDSARNIEAAAWMLGNRRNADGKLFLLSDSWQGEPRNLSYQRLIGQMISTQDNLAEVISHKTGRLIKNTIVNAASMVLIPIPI